MKKILFAFVISAMVFSSTGCGKGNDTEVDIETTTSTASETNSVSIEDYNIEDLVKENIDVEIGTIEMKDDNNGTAEVTITYPDFESFTIDGNDEEEYNSALISHLLSEDMKTKTATVQVPVTVTDGEQVVSYEEAVDDLLEKSLIGMINSITEEES